MIDENGKKVEVRAGFRIHCHLKDRTIWMSYGETGVRKGRIYWDHGEHKIGLSSIDLNEDDLLEIAIVLALSHGFRVVETRKNMYKDVLCCVLG